ncbi:DUF4405 domain-containing protein [Methanolobus sp.]|jgi:cytochrome b subunit of formate dehydrogenase|uniref:DUF4405 domain-containing protein n=1 Tax=Methanolobus sp. TaxID=1874737 RepID=UPI0025DB603C|nr:DUF4405 domain-containing protein [Methanolobus sp.]
MNRTKVSYSVDVILTILFLVVAVTGFVMFLVIPSGVPKGQYQEYLGITKATWTLIHNRSAIIMTLFMGLHLVLHRKWMCYAKRNIFKKRKKQIAKLTMFERTHTSLLQIT